MNSLRETTDRKTIGRLTPLRRSEGGFLGHRWILRS